jgi:hypothetical protein
MRVGHGLCLANSRRAMDARSITRCWSEQGAGLVASLTILIACGKAPSDVAEHVAAAGGSPVMNGPSSSTSSTGSGAAPAPHPCDQGNRYYVAMDGDDASSGTTPEEALRTVQTAADLATQPGDVICIREGFYPENVFLRDSGAEGSPITITSYPNERAGLYGMGIEARDSYDGNPVPIGWLVVAGLEITVNGEDVEGGIGYRNLHNAIIRHNYIHDLPNFNNPLRGTGHDILIDGNIMANVGVITDDCEKPCGTYMIYGSGMNYTFVNNIVYGMSGYGIHARGEACDYVSWVNGLCSETGCAAATCAGVEFAHANNWIIANNVFAHQQHGAAMVAWAGNTGGGQTTGWTIANNIFYENCNGDHPPQYPYDECTVNGIVLYAGEHTIENNLFYAPDKTAIYANEYSSYTESGNVEGQDPGFVDVQGRDFHLLPGSPAIDSGLDLGVTADIEGTPRPQGGGFDRGAYEQ